MSSGDYGGLHDKLLRKLGDPVMPARLEHKVRIGNLLDRVGIAHPVLEQFWPYYLVIPGEDDAAPLVGCVAIEMVGDVALLRMLAVAPERRGEGLGYVLVEAATERARTQGVRHLYLVTDGAQGYFGEKLGFAGDRSQGRRRADPGDRRVRAGALEERDLDAQGAMTADDPLEHAREVAVGIAREAGRILLEGWGTRPAIGFKSEDINLVTEYDKRSEALIVERLAAAFPDDRVVAEEGTTRGEARRRAARLVRRSAGRHDQLRARHAAVLGVAGAGDQPPPGAGRRRGARARLDVRGHEHGRRLDVQRQADRAVAGRSAGGRAAGDGLSVPAQPGAEQHGRVRGADGGGAGDAAARIGGAGSLLRRVRVAGRLLGARAARRGIWWAARRSCWARAGR